MSLMETVPAMTPTEICNNLNNHSVSKFQYSFSKANRFNKEHREGADQFYNLPSAKEERSTILGYGQRSNFTKGFSCGADNLYNVKRSFDPNNLIGPKYSFPNGRESYEKVFNPNMKTNTDKSFPGPGQYNNTKPFGEDSIKFSLAGKLGSSLVTNRDAPGPGTYKNPNQLNDTGKYPSSLIRNIKVSNFGNDKEERFNYRYNNVPGPKYKYNSYISKPIFNSQFKSSFKYSFAGRYNTEHKDDTPGPGSYQYFSEFGTLKLKEYTEEEKKKIRKKLLKERKKRLLKEKKKREEEMRKLEEEERKKKEKEDRKKLKKKKLMKCIWKKRKLMIK
jgi:hypothetical protein